jgi:hypothetical protein
MAYLPGADEAGGKIADTRESEDALRRRDSGMGYLRRTDPVKAEYVTVGDIERDVMDCWPLPNVWLGVSCEDQQRADERIPWLLKTPAAVRFLSCEPLLGPIQLTKLPAPSAVQLSPNGGLCYDALKDNADRYYEPPSLIDWVIVGGESGPGARVMAMQDLAAIDARTISFRVPGVPVCSASAQATTSMASRDVRGKEGASDPHL